MRVTVRLFARLRELAGAELLVVDVAEPATAKSVWQSVATAKPALLPFASAVSCAINANFSRMSQPIAEGDDVAFLPPVSGG